MIKKPNQLKRDFFESERNFRLLVQGITDYAICMLDPAGNVTNWNADQGVQGQRDSRQAFLDILPARRSRSMHPCARVEDRA